jgi:hypothetical protein
MANVTLKTGTNQAEVVHAGVNAAVCSISMSATTSSGDVLRIGKLPHQAVNTSRSDDNAQRFTYITCTPTGVISVGNYGRLVVFYKLPGQNVT